MEDIDLPFRAEYAKTGGASCKRCKTNIAKDTLCLAAMVQSAFHVRKQPNWFHERCFFKTQCPTSAGDIGNLKNISYEHQERVKKQITELGKGKKRTKAEGAAAKDFGIEYAKSGRAECRGCFQKILKDQVRVRKTVFDNKRGQPLWHHIECFAQVRGELGWLATGDNLPGFKSLSKNDQKVVRDALPAVKSIDVPDSKKAKLGKKDSEEIEEEKKLADKVKSQSKGVFKYRYSVKEHMTKRHITELLDRNGQESYPGDSETIDKCKVCKGNQIMFQKSGYVCNGQLTESSKCMNLEKKPKRKPVSIPSTTKSKYDSLKNVEKAVEARAIQYIPPSPSTTDKNVAMQNRDELDGPKVKREKPPLYLLQLAHMGLKTMESDLKERILKLGGKLDTKINEEVITSLSIKEDKKSASMMRLRSSHK